MTNKFTNGLFTITDIEYGTNDYANVDGYGKVPIVFDLDNYEDTHIIINGEKHLLNEFIRIKGE